MHYFLGLASHTRVGLSLLCTIAFVCLRPVFASPAPTKTLNRRDLFSDLFSGLPKDLQDDASQGVLQSWWTGIPKDESAIEKAFGVNDLDSLNATLEFLNIPSYANYTDGWNLRLRGQLYTEPYFKLPQSTQDSLAQDFVPGVNWSQLTPHEQENARNMTGALFSVPKHTQELTFLLKFAGQSPGVTGGSGEVWEERITYQDQTNAAGEINGSLSLPSNGLPNGNTQGGVVGFLNIWTDGIPTGNATGYLVPQEGITILSDVDDVLRVVKIWDPKEGLQNSFARDYVPWLNMPSIFAQWASSSAPNSNSSPYHFHYLTTTPEQATRVYMNFVYNYYPLGSFDTRPLLFSNPSDTFAARLALLNNIFETFPKRRFVLLGDISNPDVMKDYPALDSAFPGQVHCILLRNVTTTDSSDHIPYNLAGFEGVANNKYMFYNTPDDLNGLDFNNGDCVNASVQQYVGGNYGYGWRNLPGGSGLDLGKLLGNNAEKQMVIHWRAMWVIVHVVVGLLLW